MWKSSTTTDPLAQISDFVRSHERFAITSHARPDGDAIGSELGLALALRSLGKVADVFNADPHPRAYSSFPGAADISVVSSIEGAYDAVFVLECNDLERPNLKNLDRYRIINIDHHPNTAAFGALNWVDSTAAAVGEMIYDLVTGLGIPLSPEVSTNLFVAISTDTGSFQFSNTSARTFNIAGDLVAHGADPGKISEVLYMNEPASKIRLLGDVLDTLEVHSSGRIAWVHLTRDMLRRNGASENETEGIVNLTLSIEGVVVAAFFRELPSGDIRISLRSKDHYDVGSVAESFGGGGHKNAAGLTLPGAFEEARSRLIPRLLALLH